MSDNIQTGADIIASIRKKGTDDLRTILGMSQELVPSQSKSTLPRLYVKPQVKTKYKKRVSNRRPKPMTETEWKAIKK